MDEGFDNGNAFAIPNLWKASTLANFDQPPTKDPLTLTLNTSDSREDQDTALGLPGVNALHLPELSDLQYGPIADLPALDASPFSSATESLNGASIIEEDVWSFSKPNEKEQIRLRSWETFYDQSFQEPRTVYISEGSPQVSDAALAAVDTDGSSRDSGPTVVIQPDPLLKSLLQLGLGRESVFYRYFEEKSTFYPLIEDCRMSGYSLEAFQCLSSSLIDAGNKFKGLWRFVQKVHSSRFSQSLVALASSFSDILNTLQIQLGDPSSPARSLFQLQSLFGQPKLILSCLSNIVEEIQDTISDGELLSKLYKIVQDSEHTAPRLRPLTLQILTSVSKPWLECVSGWLGLAFGLTSRFDQQLHLPSFVRSEETTRKSVGGKEFKVLEFEFEPHQMPTFITSEDAQLIFETGRSLQLIKIHQPGHPLLWPTPANEDQLAGLQWHYSWEDVERIQTQAKAYELKLQKAIKDFNLHGGKPSLLPIYDNVENHDNEVKSEGISEEKAKAYFSAFISAIETPLPQLDIENGATMAGIRSPFEGYDVPDEETFAPPTSLLPVLSFNPLISTQSHLINRTCLRLLFREHDIESHFSLLYRYNLLGDGVFASRLSHALFDPELRTTERRKGHSRPGTSGLKLGSRETWPPASSELRLALMGILAESYYQNKPSEDASSMFRDELPGCLSFSVREMSEEELQRCMNPDSIEALDFLKLDYRPQSPLDAVITQSSLLKYDAVFKLLLRAVRMLFVIDQLFRDTTVRRRDGANVDPLTQSFRIESHHFVSATCNYFFEGVQANWDKLEDKLGVLKRGLDREGSESLSNLRDFHERTLDGMMFALILRKRQEQVMKLLEDIFSLVLQFARHIRLEQAVNTGDTGVKSTTSETELQELYAKFQKKVRVFVSVCRGLHERRGPGGTSSAFSKDEDAREDAGNTLSHLLLKLEVSGFYAKN